MNFKRFILYQGAVGMAAGMIFPFYILLLKDIGNSYSQFGWAYGLFALTAALSFPVIGKLADRIGDKWLMLVYSWGMALLLLVFPLAFEIWHVYVLQIAMGLLGAVQKNTEKTVLARTVKKETAGKEIGTYHVWTSIGISLAVIATGYLVDFLTIGSIFYIASLVFAWSGFHIMKIEDVPSAAK
ncbi:MFS transporter [Planococcus sp. N028]|uniref:MFS transporter n=1 Tax=Planococcus shixiaomingii TaxID=3058393 RepID=A0ABT8MZA6_9BACL|nr:MULTISPECIES: MFS transporter [unclassified Planococcus (in: firmicutes)]MDN7240818.1 MFS transporter [Planococcus sp. N028]WKA53064.1 MFS transporter [Planococcus sp. N022]